MLYFLIYLFFEVLVSVNLSSQIGGFNTFFELIGSAMLGIVILSNFKNSMMQNLRSVSLKQIDLQQFQKLNIFTLVGAILLIIPGFLTDIIGVLLQFSVLTSMLVNRFSVPSVENHQQYYKQKFNQEKEISDEIIDVEIISDNSAK